MRAGLETAECPLDAQMENVLPGVHQRFVATDSSIAQLDTKVSTLSGNLKQVVKEAMREEFCEMEASKAVSRRQHQTTLANALVTAAECLLQDGSPSAGEVSDDASQFDVPMLTQSPSPRSPQSPTSPALSPADPWILEEPMESPIQIQTNQPARQPQQQTQRLSSPTEDCRIHSGHRMRPQHNQLSEVCCEWVGED